MVHQWRLLVLQVSTAKCKNRGLGLKIGRVEPGSHATVLRKTTFWSMLSALSYMFNRNVVLYTKTYVQRVQFGTTQMPPPSGL